MRTTDNPDRFISSHTLFHLYPIELCGAHSRVAIEVSRVGVFHGARHCS
jgi:hypothetical protein